MPGERADVELVVSTTADTRGMQETVQGLNNVATAADAATNATNKVGQATVAVRETVRNSSQGQQAIQPITGAQAYATLVSSLKEEFRALGVETQNLNKYTADYINQLSKLGQLNNTIGEFSNRLSRAAQSGKELGSTNVIGQGPINVREPFGIGQDRSQVTQEQLGNARRGEPVKVEIAEQAEPLTTVQPRAEREKPQTVQAKPEDRRQAVAQAVTGGAGGATSAFPARQVSAPITFVASVPIIADAPESDAATVTPPRPVRRPRGTRAPVAAPVAEDDSGGAPAPTPIRGRRRRTVIPPPPPPPPVTTVAASGGGDDDEPQDPEDITDEEAAQRRRQQGRVSRQRAQAGQPQPLGAAALTRAFEREEAGIARLRVRIGPREIPLARQEQLRAQEEAQQRAREIREARTPASAAVVGPAPLGAAQLTAADAAQQRERERQEAATERLRVRFGPRVQTGAQLRAAEIREARTPASQAVIGPAPLGTAALTAAAERDQRERDREEAATARLRSRIGPQPLSSAQLTRAAAAEDRSRLGPAPLSAAQLTAAANRDQRERERATEEARRAQAQADRRSQPFTDVFGNTTQLAPRTSGSGGRGGSGGGGGADNAAFRPDNILRFTASLVGLGVGLSLATTAGRALNTVLDGTLKASEETAQSTRLLTAAFGAQAGQVDAFAKSLGNSSLAFGAIATRQQQLQARPLNTGGNLRLETQQTDALIEASQQLADIRNEDPSKVFTAFTAALNGSADAAESLGLILNDAYLSQIKLDSATGETLGTLNAAQRAQLVYSEILRQVGQQQQNLVGSAASASTLQRQAANNITQATVQINEATRALVGEDPFVAFSRKLVDVSNLIKEATQDWITFAKTVSVKLPEQPEPAIKRPPQTEGGVQNLPQSAFARGFAQGQQPENPPRLPASGTLEAGQEGPQTRAAGLKIVDSITGAIQDAVGTPQQPIQFPEVRRNAGEPPDVAGTQLVERARARAEGTAPQLELLGNRQASRQQTPALFPPEYKVSIDSARVSQEQLAKSATELTLVFRASTGTVSQAVEVNSALTLSYTLLTQEIGKVAAAQATLSQLSSGITAGRSLQQQTAEDITANARAESANTLVTARSIELYKAKTRALLEANAASTSQTELNYIENLTRARIDLAQAQQENLSLQRDSIQLGGREARAQLNALPANRRVQDLQRGNERDLTIARDLTVNPFERAAAQQRAYQRTVQLPRAQREAFDANAPAFELGRQQEVLGLLGRIAAANESSKQATLDVLVQFAGSIVVEGNGGAQSVVGSPEYAAQLQAVIQQKIQDDFNASVRESLNTPSQALAGVPMFSR